MSSTTESIISRIRAVSEALNTSHRVSRVYFAREARGVGIEQIKKLAKEHKVRFDFVDVGQLGRMVGTRQHQDVAARLAPLEYTPMEDLYTLAEHQQSITIVALDQIQHSGNLGLMLRTAVGAGVDAVLLPARGGRGISEEVIRASAGAAYHLRIVLSNNLVQDLERLKQEGFWIYGLDTGGETALFDLQWPDRCVLVVGNETKGLRPLVRKRVDALVRIPMVGKLESLNVAVALGIAIFDKVRQSQ